MAEQEQARDPVIAGGESGPGAPERSRAYVAALQRDLNQHLQRLGSPARLSVDGEWDAATDRAFRRVCRVLGIAPSRDARTYRLVAGAAAVLTESERTRRAAEGARYEEELRRHFDAERRATRAVADALVPPDVDLDDDDDIDVALADLTDDLDDDEPVGEPPPGDVVVSVRFDPASWQMLRELAAREKAPIGTALGSAIQRAAHLERIAADGGQLMVKRGRRLYRLRPRGK
jgi:hypothetical protein